MDTLDKVLMNYLENERNAYQAVAVADAYARELDRVSWDAMSTPLGRAFREASNKAYWEAERNAKAFGFGL